MQISVIRMENWKNFRLAEVQPQRGMFVIEPNASSKSDFLDAIRFLREVSDPEGGFQRAAKSRGGVSQIHCLHARKQPKVAIEVKLEIDQDEWRYRIEFGQDNQRRAVLASEVASKTGS